MLFYQVALSHPWAIAVLWNLPACGPVSLGMLPLFYVCLVCKVRMVCVIHMDGRCRVSQQRTALLSVLLLLVAYLNNRRRTTKHYFYTGKIKSSAHVTRFVSNCNNVVNLYWEDGEEAKRGSTYLFRQLLNVKRTDNYCMSFRFAGVQGRLWSPRPG